MERERWKRIQELFDAAADLSPDQRSTFLRGNDPSLVDEVLAMLEEDKREGFILDGDVKRMAARLLGSDVQSPFQEFGPYRIKSLLGEGGMGVVYLAERTDLGNQVAIKILRDGQLSPARRRRFAAEQRILAQFDHPSIARLYDADMSPDGTPWFVMEYVDGLPLTQYCREHDPPVGQRLKLFRAACEAVQYAHQRGVIHRDLKPSNILVKQDGAVRLLDFGIAQRLDVDPADRTRTGLRFMTPAYAAPEQIRGEAAGVHTDIYSLGVIFYELLAERSPFDLVEKTPLEAERVLTSEEPAKPSKYSEMRAESWADLDVIALTAMHKDATRRYASVEALIRDIDHYLSHEPLEARRDSLAYTLAKFARRNWQTISAVALTAVLILCGVAVASMLRSSSRPARAAERTIAVLPFHKSANQPDLNFLSIAIPEEIARVLSYAPSLSVRPFDSLRPYAGTLNPEQAGRDMRVSTIITGEYAREADLLQVSLTAIDVHTSRYFWRETFRVPARNVIELQAEIAAKTRESLGPLLGVSEFRESAQPRNAEAYDLYLRATGLYSDPAEVSKAIELFRKSLDLDPDYAPAWAALAVRYRLEGWYSGGGSASLDRAEAAAERGLSLDPNNADAARGLIVSRTGRGEVVKAYAEASDFLKRRPDNAEGHFALSYVFRYVGLLDEAAHECEAVFQIDPLDGGNRSCGILFMLRGDYRRAMDFINLDAGSEWARTFTMETMLRQSKVTDAISAGPQNAPKWAAFKVLFASLAHAPSSQIEALARAAKPEDDAEANYLAAAHLAYAGQPKLALDMLSHAIQGGYCAFPVIDRDPLLANARSDPEYRQIRADAIDCQNKFIAQRRTQ